MSLRFYFGPSGSGKSRQLHEEILRRARQNKKQNFLMIVPDQFTMQTQKDLVRLSPQGGILNIDVLSFGRLGHRILGEVGYENVPVLDDTGKSLVLQKVASNVRGELSVLGSFLNRQGYIHEVKSALSEFMQYGIGVQDMPKLIACAGKRGALAQKLKDLEILYREFTEYIQGNFITTEEKLDVLANALPKSALLPGSVVVFDGFTGFTPIQYRVIQVLMQLCGEVIVSLTLGAGENPYQPDGEQCLFHLSKKTVSDLERLAKEAGVERRQDVFAAAAVNRFAEAPALAHLERNLFRYEYQTYTKKQSEIRLFAATTPREEVHQTGLEICRLIREQGLAYRDIAVILGDLESYAPHVENEFAKMKIPCFLDRTCSIQLNPMIESIVSALELFLKDFSYESVFRYLRSGLTDWDAEEVDELENYCIRTGVRGYRKWSRLFTHKTEEMGEEDLQRMNDLRRQLIEKVEVLRIGSSATAREYVDCLYEFLTRNGTQQKLVEYEELFTARGELSRAREYAQIYRLVMELLNQIYDLLGDEKITLQEFVEILQAGFGEITIGTIPQNVDRVVAGDVERTRLKQVKVLFFLGLNDGNIPKGVSKGGIISDMDREFLRESDLELAPSPRQQMYIQRLYLYMNLTKPSHKLYLSFAKMNHAGKSMRPAYLVDMVRNLFPGMAVEYPQEQCVLEQMVNMAQGREFLAGLLREYAQGTQERPDRLREFYTVYQAYGEGDAAKEREKLTEAAFRRYREQGLAAAIARALYGKNLENSVSRLETFAACEYRHFLEYGLSLKEREEFGFERVDMGNVYHAVLDIFGDKLKTEGYTWFDFPEEFGERAVREALQAYAATYGETVLYSSARNAYAITRMERILTRTVMTLQEQLKHGVFCPQDYELSFRTIEDLDSVRIALSEEEKMYLRGRIDRIDVAEDAEHVYVKVIDYKSGRTQFDLAALYYGLQLQLVVYMNAAMEREASRHPDKEIVPAAVLYYHIADPVVESSEELEPEELEKRITEQLCTDGVVNSAPEVVDLLDRDLQGKSQVIPVAYTASGAFTKTSGALSGEDLKTISDYVSEKVRSLGRGMMAGNIHLNPCEYKIKSTKMDSCEYCSYKKVCGFDPSIPGHVKRELESPNREELLERMRRSVQGEHSDGED